DIFQAFGADSLSAESILNIQQTLGNHATQQILNRKSDGNYILTSSSRLQRRKLIQRMPTVADIQEAVDKDIAKREEEQKKKEAEEAASKKESEESENKEDKSLFDAVVSSTKTLVESVAKAVGDIIDKAVYDNL